LYALPPVSALDTRLSGEGVVVRRALASERTVILDWVEATFGPRWANEAAVSLAGQPTRCWVAVELGPTDKSDVTSYAQPSETLLGFACFDAVRKGLFGPMGVREASRGRGVGRLLLVRCLEDMERQGYAYAVAAWVGSVAFYEKTVGAAVIEGSEPGLYRGPLVQ
jgi:GNAT superfamily N-acetyltransferase